MHRDITGPCHEGRTGPAQPATDSEPPGAGGVTGRVRAALCRDGALA